MNDINSWKIGKVYEIIYNKLYFTVHQNNEHTLHEIKKYKSKFFFQQTYMKTTLHIV